jgi:hypothetical protein
MGLPTPYRAVRTLPQGRTVAVLNFRTDPKDETIMTYSFDASVDPDIATSRAHVLLESEIDARIAAIREAAKRRTTLHEALAAYEDGLHLAVQAGWTVEQLRQIGLKEAENEKPAETAAPVDATPAAYAPPVAIHSEFRAEPVSVPAYQYGGPIAVSS